MALLNTAFLLAQAGRRVLLIDCDLEAPGLSRTAVLKREQRSKGFLELITDYLDQCQDMSSLPEPQPRELALYITTPTIADAALQAKVAGRIDLIPAGRLDEDYAQRLAGVDFKALYKDYHGFEFFRHFKELLDSCGRYDYVLIDSRTGFSDISGICTVDLANFLVVLFNLSEQSLQGTREVLDIITQARDEEQLATTDSAGKTLLVASPMPEGEEESKAKRLKEAKDKHKLDPQVFLSYHPLLALEEKVVVLRWPQSALARAYEDLYKKVRELVGDGWLSLIRNGDSALRESRFADALQHYRDAGSLDAEKTIEHLQRQIRETLSRYPEYPDYGEGFFCLLEELAPNDPVILSEYGKFLMERNAPEDLEKARGYYHKALKLFPPGLEAGLPETYARYGWFLHLLGEEKPEEQFDEAFRARPGEEKSPEVHLYYARFLAAQGRDDEAEKHFDSSLPYGGAEAYLFYAEFLGQEKQLGETEEQCKKRLDEAEWRYEQALELWKDGVKIRLSYADFLAKRRRDFTQAEQHYQKAIELRPSSESYRRYANAYLEVGERIKAEGAFRQALAINEQDFQTHCDYADFLASQQRWEEAERHYRRALELKADWETHNTYAWFLSRQNRLDETEEQYRRSLTLKDNPAAHVGLADVCEKRFLTPQALEHYRHAIRLGSRDPVPYGRASLILRDLWREAEGRAKEAAEAGEAEEAREADEEAVRLNAEAEQYEQQARELSAK